MSGDPKVLAARAEAQAARARLLATVEETKRRLSPAVLAGDAVDGIRTKASAIAGDSIEAVKHRPWIAAAAAGALGLFIARKPIVRRLGGGSDGADDTPETTTKPKSQRRKLANG